MNDKIIIAKGIATNGFYEDVIIMNILTAYLMTPYLLFWGPLKCTIIICKTMWRFNPLHTSLVRRPMRTMQALLNKLCKLNVGF